MFFRIDVLANNARFKNIPWKRVCVFFGKTCSPFRFFPPKYGDTEWSPERNSGAACARTRRCLARAMRCGPWRSLRRGSDVRVKEAMRGGGGGTGGAVLGMVEERGFHRIFVGWLQFGIHESFLAHIWDLIWGLTVFGDWVRGVGCWWSSRWWSVLYLWSTATGVALIMSHRPHTQEKRKRTREQPCHLVWAIWAPGPPPYRCLGWGAGPTSFWGCGPGAPHEQDRPFDACGTGFDPRNQQSSLQLEIETAPGLRVTSVLARTTSGLGWVSSCDFWPLEGRNSWCGT